MKKNLKLVHKIDLVHYVFVKENFGSNVSGEKDSDNIIDVETSLAVPYGGGTRAGLFRTPISGGVQSATSAHGLPRPALAVRNLMEQVKKSFPFVRFYVLDEERC